MSNWLTAKDAAPGGVLLDLWPGCWDGLSEEALEVYLSAAAEQCKAYAPAIPKDKPIPQNYQLAQVIQARALARTGIVGSGDSLGMDGETVTIFPMDWTVKNLLRPQRRPHLA